MRRCLLALLFGGALCWAQTDVVIYGGTPAGLAAARAARREGVTVTVIEPTGHIGGMVTGGIAVTDTGTPHFVGGISREFFEEIAAAKQRAYGAPKEPLLLFRGKELPWRVPRRWDLEPRMAKALFERWVSEDGYKVHKAVRVTRVRKTGRRITGIGLSDGSVVFGKVFIDASYEGDLMARADVRSTFGRESSAHYGEKLAGVREPHFVKNYTPEEYQTPTIAYMHHGQFGADLKARDGQGRLLWGVEARAPEPAGSGDQRVQAYCFRLIVTQRAELKLEWPKPDHYDASRYELLLQYVKAHPGMTFTRLVHLGSIPNGKYDLNASGPFSIDFVGGNFGYPGAGYPDRDRMLHAHEDYEKGFFWFLTNDRRVPPDLRGEARSWGPAKDEFTDNGNWPTQLYIRESRRMIGEYVSRERDMLVDRTKEDSMGLGSFVLDSHWVRRFANAQGFVRVEGHLDESINLAERPYEIAYRSLIPKRRECENLLVPVCLSATHVAMCTIRMEPVYMILGHSVGVAAAMAVKAGTTVQDVDVPMLMRKLMEQGQVLHREQRKPSL